MTESRKNQSDSAARLQKAPDSFRIARGVERGKRFTFNFEDREIAAYDGETVAGALLASGILAFRLSERENEPRGYFCGMGICFECRVVIDNQSNQRACATFAEPGMQVRMQRLLTR